MDDIIWVDLRDGMPELLPEENSHCFFVVEHLNDRHFIYETARQMLSGGCRDFQFFGKHAAQWELMFDETDLLLHDCEDDWSDTACWYERGLKDALMQLAEGEKVYVMFDWEHDTGLKTGRN
ncbi:MAG: hypothetical protein IJO88_05515 [Oscillospiraceae bacterium]|nr:hypothetical protein [Oscillospiraceae bacterium]